MLLLKALLSLMIIEQPFGFSLPFCGLIGLRRLWLENIGDAELIPVSHQMHSCKKKKPHFHFSAPENKFLCAEGCTAL